MRFHHLKQQQKPLLTPNYENISPKIKIHPFLCIVCRPPIYTHKQNNKYIIKQNSTKHKSIIHFKLKHFGSDNERKECKCKHKQTAKSPISSQIITMRPFMKHHNTNQIHQIHSQTLLIHHNTYICDKY